jgi:hypothetical protein
VLVLAVAGSPAWAQLPWPSAPVAPGTPPIEQPYGAPLLGVQSTVTVPAPGAGPPLPPAPSQTHLPPLLPPPAPPGTKRPFEFHPTVGLSEQYSDNFFLTSTNRTENYRTTLNPGFLVGINDPRASGTVSASAGITQDSVDSAGDLHYFPSASAALKYVFDPRLSLSLVDSFARSDSTALANQFGLQTQRTTFTSNRVGVAADWLIDVLATQAYYQYSLFSGTSDTNSQIAGVDVGLPVGTAMAVKGGYEYSYSNTTGTTTSGIGPAVTTGHLGWASIARQISSLRSVGIQGSYAVQSLQNTSIWNVSVFTALELPGRLSLSGSIGYGQLTSDSGDFSTVTSHTSLRYQRGPAVLSLAADSDFNQSFLTGANFGITLTRSYTAGLDYALTPTLSARARGSYSDNEFTGVGNNKSSPDQQALTATGGLAWHPWPWLSVAIDYTYTRYYTGSSLSSSNVTAIENRATVSLNTQF